MESVLEWLNDVAVSSGDGRGPPPGGLPGSKRGSPDVHHPNNGDGGLKSRGGGSSEDSSGRTSTDSGLSPSNITIPLSPRVTASGVISSLRDDAQMVGELLQLIRETFDEEDIFEPICSQLLTLYQRGGSLRVFVLQCIPAFLWTYMEAMSVGKRRQCTLIETFLLAVYSEEIMEDVSDHRIGGNKNRQLGNVQKDFGFGRNLLVSPASAAKSPLAERSNRENLRRKIDFVKVPTLATPSIYHEPSNISQSILNDQSLNRLNPPSCSGGEETSLHSNSAIQIGPFPSVDQICAENRFMVLTRVLRAYNQHLSQYSHVSLKTLCQFTSSITRSGFHFPESELVDKVLGNSVRTRGGKQPRDYFQSMDDHSDKPRVNINPIFIQECLNGVYYSLFNGVELQGLRALDDVHQRASFELLPNVLLVTNAIMNSLLENPSGTPNEGPMGIRISTSNCSFLETSPSESNHRSSAGAVTPGKRGRRLVTNASLRIKRMPEDIPVKAPVDTSSPPSARRKALSVIVETANKAKEQLKVQKEGKSSEGKEQNAGSSPKISAKMSSNTDSSPYHPSRPPTNANVDPETKHKDYKNKDKESKSSTQLLGPSIPMKPSRSEITVNQWAHDQHKKELKSKFLSGKNRNHDGIDEMDSQEGLVLKDIMAHPPSSGVTAGDNGTTDALSTDHVLHTSTGQTETFTMRETLAQKLEKDCTISSKARSNSIKTNSDNISRVLDSQNCPQLQTVSAQSSAGSSSTVIGGYHDARNTVNSSREDLQNSQDGSQSSRSGSYLTPRDRTPESDPPNAPRNRPPDRSYLLNQASVDSNGSMDNDSSTDTTATTPLLAGLGSQKSNNRIVAGDFELEMLLPPSDSGISGIVSMNATSSSIVSSTVIVDGESVTRKISAREVILSNRNSMEGKSSAATAAGIRHADSSDCISD